MDSSRHHALKTRMEDLHGTVAGCNPANREPWLGAHQANSDGYFPPQLQGLRLSKTGKKLQFALPKRSFFWGTVCQVWRLLFWWLLIDIHGLPCPNMRTQPSNVYNVWIYNQPTSHSMRISWDIWDKKDRIFQKQIKMWNAPGHCSLENEIHGIFGCPICRLTHMYECIWIVLVGGLGHLLFFHIFHILGIIIPTDFHIFRGVGIPPTRYELYISSKLQDLMYSHPHPNSK